MKLIREHIIFEKFIEHSDPISDLEIGFGEWANLKPGDVIQCVQSFNKSADRYLNKLYYLIYEIKHKENNIYMQILPFSNFGVPFPRALKDIKNKTFNSNTWIIKKDKFDIHDCKKYFRIVPHDEYEQYVNEAFTEDSDPIKDLGIGIINKILPDLKRFGLSEKDVIVEDDGTFFLNPTTPRYSFPESFINIQLKYFPKAQKILLHNIEKSKLKIETLIDQAHDDGLTYDQIERIIKHTLNRNVDYHHPRYNETQKDLTKARIYITKLKRNKEQEEHDEQNNIYVFIGFTSKVPIDVNGKKYYEDKLDVENMIKIDKFNTNDLAQVEMMKMRLRFQPYEDGAVYMLEVPKEIMDEDNYYKIPEHLYDIVNKYKRKI